MKIQICFLLEKNFKSVFSENTNMFLFKKMFLYLIAYFEIKEELKHVNQLKNMSKKILTKHINMANMN